MIIIIGYASLILSCLFFGLTFVIGSSDGARSLLQTSALFLIAAAICFK